MPNEQNETVLEVVEYNKNDIDESIPIYEVIVKEEEKYFHGILDIVSGAITIAYETIRNRHGEWVKK